MHIDMIFFILRLLCLSVNNWNHFVFDSFATAKILGHPKPHIIKPVAKSGHYMSGRRNIYNAVPLHATEAIGG
jgi:hypothetical protein